MSAPPDIFLSYSRDDQARAKLFAEAFEREGFRVWWDVGLRAGEAYDTVTETALKTAKAVVVLWSKRSVESRWVRAEATLADRNRTLVPAMIEACERPIMFELTQTAELMHWRGDGADAAFRTFLGDVRRFVARELAPEVPTIFVAAPTVEETLKPGQTGSAPSLAVLPFKNRSSNPDDEVFAEGMVEDVIAALSQSFNIRVLGSASTRSLGPSAVNDTARVGRQLGVRYLLEGNVRRNGPDLRVTTQLLEAMTGEIVWTGRFDRPLSELANLQEELVTDVAASLDAQVYNLEMARSVLKKPGDLTAWEAISRAMSGFGRFDPESMRWVVAEAERAVAMAPDYAQAHGMQAVARAHNFLASGDLAEINRVYTSATHALQLAPDNAFVMGYVGHALQTAGFVEQGLLLIQSSLRKFPASGLIQSCLAQALARLSRHEESIATGETAFRLMPGSLMQAHIKGWQSFSFVAMGRLTDANIALDQALVVNPGLGFTHVMKARLCSELGHESEAFNHIQTAIRLGWTADMATGVWQRVYPRNPQLESHAAAIRKLFAAAERRT
jgi:TolB-like protein/Tfp pilus assembly protein PilF